MIGCDKGDYTITVEYQKNVTLPCEYLEYLFKAPTYELFIARIIDLAEALLFGNTEEMIKQLHRRGVI